MLKEIELIYKALTKFSAKIKMDKPKGIQFAHFVHQTGVFSNHFLNDSKLLAEMLNEQPAVISVRTILYVIWF